MIENNLTVIIMGGGKGKRLGIPKVFYQFRGKALWSILYDKFNNFTKEIIIVGLDIDSASTRKDSLILALKQVKTEKVLVVDINMPLLSTNSIQKIIDKINYDSVSAITWLDETVFDNVSKQYNSNSQKCVVEPLQLFHKELLLECLLKDTNKDEIEFSNLIYKETGILPVMVEIPKLETYKLITKDDAHIIDNMMKASR
jgi:molybdopterin-guanine dinucleotide biosynthesis protein A